MNAIYIKNISKEIIKKLWKVKYLPKEINFAYINSQMY